MPEGDTVHKLAAELRRRLLGATLQDVRLRRLQPGSLRGARVTDVSAKGKHLFLDTDAGLSLRSHLGMYGSWHSYRPGEPWRKPERQADIVLVTVQGLFVCFNARETEILSKDGFRHRDAHHRLGPDLIDAAVQVEGLPSRARGLLAPDALLVDVLLDQRVACGIGNVYKSEVLFMEGQPPERRLAETTDQVLAALYRQAAGLLRKNLGGGPRVTRRVADGRSNLWVYRRRSLPCLRCGAEVEGADLGRILRSTYWCPSCQKTGRM